MTDTVYKLVKAQRELIAKQDAMDKECHIDKIRKYHTRKLRKRIAKLEQKIIDEEAFSGDSDKVIDGDPNWRYE